MIFTGIEKFVKVAHLLVEGVWDIEHMIREVIKKNGKKAVRLTAWGGVNPLQPDRFYL